MDNLKEDLLKDIEFLKTKGIINDLTTFNDYELLFGGSKYDYKTREVIKDIISILDIEPSFKEFITLDLYKFFDDYNKEVYSND